MNVSSKRPISGIILDIASWRFLFIFAELCRPAVMESYCIVCHPVLRHPSEHGTAQWANTGLAKVHIGKVKRLTVSWSNRTDQFDIDETVWPYSSGKEVAYTNCKFANVIQIWYLGLKYNSWMTDKMLNWHQRTLKLPSFQDTGIVTSYRLCFSSCSMECDIILWVTMVIQWISKRFGFQSANTLSNVCQRIRTDSGYH